MLNRQSKIQIDDMRHDPTCYSIENQKSQIDDMRHDPTCYPIVNRKSKIENQTMAINYKKDTDGIVTLTVDMPDRSANVLNAVFYDAYTAVLDQLEADDSAIGAILVSGKPKIWIAGADIDNSFEGNDPQTFFDGSQSLKAHLRRMEKGKPVVAALNGTALGGGLEVALACHHRIAIDNDKIKLGFPEVGLGLLPGGGGVARSPRLMGMQTALEWLTQNKKYTPKKALAAGAIHALAADLDRLAGPSQSMDHSQSRRQSAVGCGQTVQDSGR